MFNIWHEISPERIHPEDFIAVVEIPKGSKKKYELDKETGLIILDRVLHTPPTTRKLRVHPPDLRRRRRPPGRTGPLL